LNKCEFNIFELKQEHSWPINILLAF